MALQGTFLLEVLLNGLADHRPHDLGLGAADRLAELQKAPLVEFDGLIARRAVDVLHNEALLIGEVLAG